MRTQRSRSVLPATVALSGVLALAACGSGQSEASDAAAAEAPGVPFSVAGSIAAPEHAAVQRAVQALAAAELKLSHDMSSVNGNTFDSYLRGLAGASASTRRSVEAIANSSGSCAGVGSAVTAASAGVTAALDSALKRLNGHVALARDTLTGINADRDAVLEAAAALKQALAADPKAWQVPGVDETSSTLAGIAQWQSTVAAAISSAQSKASSYGAIRSQVFTRAAGVSRACTQAAVRAQVRRTAGPTSPAGRAATAQARELSPAGQGSSASSLPPTTTQPATKAGTPVASRPSSTAPAPESSSAATTPSTTPTSPSETPTSPSATPTSPTATPTVEPTVDPTPTDTGTATVEPTPTDTGTATVEPTVDPTPTDTGTATVDPAPTDTGTPAPASS